METLKAEDDLRKAKLEAYRKAREEVKALEPLMTKYIPVSYSSAASEVKPHIENILTKSRGSVTVDEKNNQIIITDTAEKVRQATEIVRRIDKVTAQVVIEARVVEASDNFSRELGITWDLSYGAGLLGDWQTSADTAMNYPSEGDSSIGISFSRLSGVPFVLNARLNALETTGEGRILSSPKILTLDNKKAKIKQGVEYPYLERDSSGGSSVKFKNIDLLLEVTPHVTPDNRISLVIFITKNDVAGITAGVPSVATNEAETELLVNDGDTIVIGGIIKSTETKGQDGFPFVSSIPILGWLFKNSSTKQQSNELLIFITPRIVQLEQVPAQALGN
jgi:type IV pilus assembly protein PilQ